MIRILENAPKFRFTNLKEIKIRHIFSRHSMVRRLIVLLIVFSFIRSIYAAQIYMDKSYTIEDMGGPRWLVEHVEDESTIMADPWSARIIYGYFGRDCWGVPVDYVFVDIDPKFDKLVSTVLIFSNITISDKRAIILENRVDYILVNELKLKEFFNQKINLYYMPGRWTVFYQLSLVYGDVEPVYEDLNNIPELEKIYSTNEGNNIIIYKVNY